MTTSVCLCIIFFLTLCFGEEIFRNPYYLADLFRKEIELSNEIQNSKLSFPSVKKYLESQKSVSNELLHASFEREPNFEVLSGNPIHIYNLMIRISEFIPAIIQDIEGTEYDKSKYYSLLNSLKNFIIQPLNKFDIVGSTLGLLRAQVTYQLDPYDMANGLLGIHQTYARLTSEDCLRLAKERLNNEIRININTGREFAVAIEWAEAAFRLAKEIDDTMLQEDIQIFLDFLIIEHDKFFVLGDSSNQFPNEEFFIDKFSNHHNITGRQLRQFEYDSLELNTETISFTRMKEFKALCRGDKLKEKNTNFHGYCTFVQNPKSFSILHPIKMEILSLNPILIQFHDVINESQINQLKEMSKNELHPSGVLTYNNRSEFELQRTQSQAWLWDTDINMQKMSKRIEIFTNLIVASTTNEPGQFIESEAFQIGVYTPGGHFVPHHDAFSDAKFMRSQDNNSYVGNRIATFMLYMNELEGGATAFPLINKVITPVTGSAAFWYNIHSDDSSDDKVLHGACPTLLGIKWVANKWIRSYSQIFKKPCGIRQGSWKKSFHHYYNAIL